MTEDTNGSSVSRRTILKTSGAASVAGLTGTAGCLGGLTGGGSNKLTLLHGWSGGDGKAAIQSMFDGFKKENSDVNAELRAIGGGGNTSLNAVINKRLKNNNPPGSWADWPGKNLLQFTKDDLLGDIGEDVWSKNSMKSAYLPGPKNAAKPNGTFVAVPTNIHRMNNLFYNKKVVEKAGVDPSKIKSPSDLTSALKTVQENGDVKAAMAHSTKGPWTTLQLWAQVLLGQQGWSGYQKFMKGNLGKSAIEKAFKTIVDYAEYFPSDAGTIGWKEANKMVMNGEAAFIHQGDWAAGMYSGNDKFNYKKQWDHVPFPGTGKWYSMNMDSWVFPKNTPAPNAAKQWLRYCGTKDAQVRFNTKKGSIPPRKDVSMKEFPQFQSDQFKDFKNSAAQPPSVAHGLAVAPGGLGKLKSAISDKFSSFDDKGASAVAKAFTNAV